MEISGESRKRRRASEGVRLMMIITELLVVFIKNVSE